LVRAIFTWGADFFLGPKPAPAAVAVLRGAKICSKSASVRVVIVLWSGGRAGRAVIFCPFPGRVGRVRSLEFIWIVIILDCLVKSLGYDETDVRF
jgi:hypothetical protein